MAKSIGEKLKTKGLMFFVSFFFHVIWKISNFNMGTAKHLAHASCTLMKERKNRKPTEYFKRLCEVHCGNN